MNSYRQILYHIVFCTYNRKNTLPHAFHGELYKYIWGIIQKRKGFLYKIGGTENHIHILSDLHPTVCLSDYIKEIKTGSNQWMKKTGNFPLFESWAEGSCSLTYSINEKNVLINYIKNQKEHHKTITFEDEFRQLLAENGIEWDERYLF
ncbi:MAG: transposase [Bacteroidales bacterium]|jgi:putative transposase|nr:transposase [Mariniphaga sp.]NLB94009.1 transposase [Bacteroidales bacterium]